MRTLSCLTRRSSLIAAVSFAVVLGGCATFSDDGGFRAVEQAGKQHANKALRWARTAADLEMIEARVAELLAGPLSADDAVQIAVFNNKGLQASFFELGIAEADQVQAGRLPNPSFSMMRVQNGPELGIEQILTFNILALITMPRAVAVETQRFEQTQKRIAIEMLSLATATRKAYYAAVAAEETVRYMLLVRKAADASAELARRMAQVGNFNKLQQAREQGFYAEAALNVARADLARGAAREQLIRLLGLWGGQTGFTLPERLPDLPESSRELPNIEQSAMAQRLDVQAARLNVEAVAGNLGLTRTTRFINALELGPARTLEGQRGDAYKRGFEVRFELPIFDWGTARVAKAEAIYMQSVNRAAETAINARSEVREAYQGYRSSFDIARHFRDEIVPLRKRIAEENQLRYNGMLIGVFDLLADARAQIASVNGYIEALRDFWMAQADLDAAMVGKPGPGVNARRTMPVAAANPGH